MIIPKLREAGRLLDVLDMAATKHSYESEPETASALVAEFETIALWNRVVHEHGFKVRPCQSKNLFTNKYKYQGRIDADQKAEYDELCAQAESEEFKGREMTVDNAHE